MRRTFLAALLGLALAACATDDQAMPTRYEGTWAFHFETSSFVADGGGDPAWLVAEGDVWRQLTAPLAVAGGPWGSAHIVVEGALSPPGHYGHLGAYTRELRVTRVIETRLISAWNQPSNN
ncbi:MAG: hypothetical protein R3C25_10955 [Hyphomonadaceae bacterium]